MIELRKSGLWDRAIRNLLRGNGWGPTRISRNIFCTRSMIRVRTPYQPDEGLPGGERENLGA